MKFRSESQYNAYVDAIIAGPIMTAEIELLMDIGVGFEPRTLDTEYSLAALAAHARAPGQTLADRAYYEGVMRVLEARLGVCGARSWDEMQGIAVGVALFTPKDDVSAVLLP